MFLCIMDDDTKEMVTTFIPALTRCPQNATEYLRQLLQILLVMIRPHPDPLLNIRHRISNGQIENWDGCDAFSDFLSHRYSFYLVTGETPENLLRLTRTTRHLFLNQTGRNYTILPVNRVMLYMMWLRFYPSYHNLALIFNVHTFFHTNYYCFFFALFNSSVDWTLILFYKFNCWENRYFEEGKKNAPAHQSDKY